MLVVGITTSLEGGRQHIPLCYPDAVRRAGGLAVLLCPPMDEALAARCAALLDGLVLSGGNDADPALYGQPLHLRTEGVDARRDAEEILLCGAFAAAGKPILGICRGVQMMNVAFGGTLLQHLPDLPHVAHDHGSDKTRHPVRLTPGSFLASVYGPEATANSTHHQAVLGPAPGFAVTAVSDDGVVEGIESGNRIGVQWHPERLYDEGHGKLFEAFLRLCGAQ